MWGDIGNFLVQKGRKSLWVSTSFLHHLKGSSWVIPQSEGAKQPKARTGWKCAPSLLTTLGLRVFAPESPVRREKKKQCFLELNFHFQQRNCNASEHQSWKFSLSLANGIWPKISPISKNLIKPRSFTSWDFPSAGHTICVAQRISLRKWFFGLIQMCPECLRGISSNFTPLPPNG